jgi:hypothetical protein
MSDPTLDPASVPSDPSYAYLSQADCLLEEARAAVEKALNLVRGAKSLAPDHPRVGPAETAADSAAT